MFVYRFDYTTRKSLIFKININTVTLEYNKHAKERKIVRSKQMFPINDLYDSLIFYIKIISITV